MSASRSTKSKSAKSPAPATKPAAEKKKTAKKIARASAPRGAAKPAKAARVAGPKPVASAPVQTTISARVDIGFGNTLFIRGEGAGLSWDAGTTMDCVSADLWRIALPESARGHTFKFLVNDLSWSTRPDYTVGAGASVTLTPEF